jgi:hypothetical protein
VTARVTARMPNDLFGFVSLLLSDQFGQFGFLLRRSYRTRYDSQHFA